MSATERLYRAPLVAGILERRRRNRLDFWLSKVSVTPGMRILDVGCGPNGRSVEDWLDPSFQIVGVDLYEPEAVHHNHPGFTYHQRDAADLSIFPDQSFDLALCIGMLEHVANHGQLDRIAAEIQRTSRQWVLMVPYRYAWLEPHFKFPFFQLLPYEAQMMLIRALDLHHLRERVKEEPLHLRRHYQWLTNREWEHIFPGSKVWVMPTRETIAIIRSDV